jgi:hypothetical protein
VPTPINDALCRLSNLVVRERWAAQTLSGDEVLAEANGSVRR